MAVKNVLKNSQEPFSQHTKIKKLFKFKKILI